MFATVDSREYEQVTYFDFDEHPEYLQFFVSTKDIARILDNLQFPVGQIDFLKIHPMTFTEMLQADNEKVLLGYLDAKLDFDPIPEAFFAPLVENLKKYFLLGGMPASVARCVNERDFAKYPQPREYPKLIQIWHSLPSQLAKENKKFFYQLVRQGARAREYEDALHHPNRCQHTRIYLSSNYT